MVKFLFSGLPVEKLPAKSMSVSTNSIPDTPKKLLTVDVNKPLSNSGLSDTKPMSDLREALAKVLANQNNAAGSSGTNFPIKNVANSSLKVTPSKNDNLKTIIPVRESGISIPKQPFKTQGSMSTSFFKK